MRHKPDMRPAGAGGVQVGRVHLGRVGGMRAAAMIYLYTCLLTCIYVICVCVIHAGRARALGPCGGHARGSGADVGAGGGWRSVLQDDWGNAGVGGGGSSP